MRICDLTTLYIDGGQGGVNTYLLEKARAISERADVSHVIVVPGARDEKRVLFGSTVYTLKSRSLPSNPGHRVLSRFKAVKEILRDEDPSVVEVDCAYMLGRVAAGVMPEGVPIIGFYHVHLPTFIARPRFSRLGFLASTAEHFAWRYVDYCYRACDRLIVTSDDMVERLSQAGFARLDHIPLGVNLDLFQPRVSSTQGDAPVELLYVGRLSHEKDLPTLLDAFAQLTPPDRYRLTIVGEGPQGATLRRQAGGDSRIRFLGALAYGEELAKVYASASVLCVPSPNETFNLTVLEGFASGLPVVAVKQGGPRGLVAQEVGELAEPGDAVDFAAKIQLLAARDVPAERCRCWVEEHYSWKRTFDRLLEVYESALQAKATVKSA